VDTGWAWTDVPQGQHAVTKMGPAFPASSSPQQAGYGSGLPNEPTGYKVVRQKPHKIIEADPDFQQGLQTRGERS